MKTSPPLINGVRYEWARVEAPIFGKLLQGITYINYGMLRLPGSTQITAYGNMGVDDFNRIQEVLPRGESLLSVPDIDIRVTFKPAIGQKLCTHILRLAAFAKHDFKPDITGMIISKIDFD